MNFDNKHSDVAIVLVNLGSPDSPDSQAVRRYLAEFLKDRRIVNTSPLIWYPILYGIILRTRPAKSAAKYAKVWNLPKLDGAPDTAPGTSENKTLAPLVRITQAQAEALQARLGASADVHFAMRYGKPALGATLSKLKTMGYAQIGILPLYPQYSRTTTASVYDVVNEWTAAEAAPPAINPVLEYHYHPLYISALTQSIQKAIAVAKRPPERIIASFHGIPQSYADAGDPYPAQCEQTVHLLREALSTAMGDAAPPLIMTYQSRFGPKKWLTPYTDDVLRDEAASGVRRVMVLTPGFSADCLETLEEINIESRQVFMEAGGEEFNYLPCLNSDPAHMDLLEALGRSLILPAGFEHHQQILGA